MSTSAGSSVSNAVSNTVSNVLPSIEGQVIDEMQAKKAQEYDNDRKRPNMHIALHYEATIKEYGIPSNMNVLIGEDKHR